ILILFFFNDCHLIINTTYYVESGLKFLEQIAAMHGGATNPWYSLSDAAPNIFRSDCLLTKSVELFKLSIFLLLYLAGSPQ
ncbi:MAG TPA: hypothetical protein VNB68_06680, partial [Nitrososphaeraceae archaeon]|nr:hypothetical protein [Nitrososphaeraceae archaeon]